MLVGAVLRLDLIDNGSIDDLAANPLAGSFGAGQVYTFDNTAPGVLSSVSSQPLGFSSVSAS